MIAPHRRWQESLQWGPSAQNRAYFGRKRDNGASILEFESRAEPEIGLQSAIGVSIQGSKRDWRDAKRPHCATFCHKRLPALQQAFLERGNYPKAHVCSADPQHQLHSSTGPRSMTLQSNSLTDPQPRLHSSADPRAHGLTSSQTHGLIDPQPQVWPRL